MTEEPITRFVGGPVHAVAARLADRGVRFVIGTAVDFSGVTRAKAVPIARFPAFVENGMGASPSWLVFCADFGIAFTPELGVTGDLRLRIDPEATTVTDHGVAWAPAEFFQQDGERFAGCARWRLRQVVERLAAAGITAATGAELEFVLTEPDGSPRVGAPWQGYGVRSMLDVAPLLAELTDGFAGAGMPIEQLHAEYGADQFEISLPPADPLTTADRTILGRILIGRAAAKHGLGVSFSPMPFAGGAGNGAHLHLSLTQADRPLFAGGDCAYGLTDQGGAAIAGLVAGLPQVQAVLAGSAVSVLRLGPGRWAGAFACWGLENREAAIRLIADTQGNPHGASVEVKCVDGSANPYLAAAVVLGLALDGITRDLPLPPEVTVDPAGLPQQPAAMPLAADQQGALDALDGSALARDILGELIVDGTLAVRRYEHATFAGAAPDDVTAAFRMAFSC
jgi:glutamine synthetase